ncbi:di-trans,poly-cis-decaprenylcistransferase, partial [Candidatus Microgenomates bacterium]|nr:di-trans,poly-cis-decaprenylcistransferase [Candidatus Microgenomates bacterium]
MKERVLGLEKERTPLSHIAFVMDGNRRWAKLHDLPLIEGYREGEKRIDPIVRKCIELGTQVVTFYTLSIDNLERPEEEVKGLFKVLREGVPLMLRKLDKEDVRFCSLGDVSRFPTDIQDAVREAGVLTQNKEGIILNLALAYGGRDEIKRAFQGIIKAGAKEEEITEKLISNSLDTGDQPDPELI